VLLVGAAGVSLVQDMDRAALPAVLSKRLYMEGNSLAYAPYNESVFATPQTLAVIAFVTFAHAWTLLISRRRQPLPGTVFLLGLVIVAAGAAYLSRIRTSLVLGAFYAVLSVTLRVRWRGAFIAAALVLVAYAAKVEIPGVGQLFEEDRTTRYYTMAFESQELMTRTRGPIDEAYAYHAYSPSILGDGGGNSGALRGLRDSPPWFVPVTNDTGYFLILVEFGLLGVVLLGAALLAVGVRGFTRPPPWLPDIGLAYAMLLVWFSMKSATILTNGVAETMLFAHLGACYAGVGGEEGAWRTRPRSPSRLSVRG
jgi:uncharacterized membrane protein